MRLVFAGTPAAALPTLRALAASRHDVAAVVTRPDAPVGRGKKMHASPVAELAAELGFETLKPVRPNEGWFLDRLRAIAPDCCPVTAYGALLPQSALDIPAHGWVNLHFSVLPAWRGAAPVQHAVLRGDDITGATTFLIVKELDAGPVFGTLTEPVRPTDTSGDLLDRLAVSGAELMVRTLDAIEDGTVRAVPQPADGVSFAPKLTPADARVDWKLPAHLIDRQVRGCTPDPGAWTEFDDGSTRPPEALARHPGRRRRACLRCRRGAGRPRPGRRGTARRQERRLRRHRHGPCPPRRRPAPGQAPHARRRLGPRPQNLPRGDDPPGTPQARKGFAPP